MSLLAAWLFGVGCSNPSTNGTDGALRDAAPRDAGDSAITRDGAPLDARVADGGDASMWVDAGDATVLGDGDVMDAPSDVGVLSDAEPVDAAPIDAPMRATCATYCAAIMTHCTGENAQYASAANCMDSCAEFTPGAIAATIGNSLECRAGQATLAEMEPEMHCRQAGPGGDAVCGTNCQGFCTLATRFCADAFIGGEATCLMACAARFDPEPPYNSGVRSGDSLACRLYQATAAASDESSCNGVGIVSEVCM